MVISVHVVCASDILCPYKYLTDQCRDDELSSLASFFLPTDTAVVACKCSFLSGDCFYPVLLSVCLSSYYRVSGKSSAHVCP